MLAVAGDTLRLALDEVAAARELALINTAMKVLDARLRPMPPKSQRSAA